MCGARPVAIVVLGLGLTLLAQPAHAQGAVPERLPVSTFDFTPALLNASTAPVRIGDVDQFPMSPIVPNRPKMGGSSLLTSLFASTAMMQALDVHSTLKAFGAGAVEGNPAMSGITQNRAAFMMTKAAVAAVTILATRKMAKKNKVAAVVTLIAVNSAYAMIVSHNYALARR